MAHWKVMLRRKPKPGEVAGFDVGDLPRGRDLVVQIERAEPGTINGLVNGRKQEDPCVWVHFVGIERPLAFKSTHCKALVQIYGEGSGEITEWAGKWLALYPEMVPDPSRGKNALCEAVRVRPTKPTSAQIAEVEKARAGGGKRQEPAGPPRDEAADEVLVRAVCLAISEAKDTVGVEAAIAPHRAELKKMGERFRSVIASCKNARLAELTPPLEEGPSHG